MKCAAVLLLVSCASATFAAAPASHETPWPAVTQTAKPWTRWWWPGSAVEPAELTRELEEFAAAGIGGVEITPIYGARGADARDIAYLSPHWVEMLAHVTREAKRLGLGVDMATGTGWPFGGPQVSAADGSSSLQLVAGKLSGKPTEMKVKRAAPGGEGLVLDPYSPGALDRYLQTFTKALSSLPRGAVRTQFHDSFEYYGASWSPALPERFRALHGYDLQQFAAELTGNKPLDADTLGRIKGDYRRTLATLHLEYVQHWTQWARANGSRARNQAHGSPGRLLDLYGASDIPETESFGATVLPIAGLRLAPDDIRDDPDPPINLIGRFASSAAHVNGKPLASSETLTWLRENFRESPAQGKPQIDRLFAAGINHIFYHGATYSPSDAAWPGWFFYAATQLNPRNPLWRDFGAMHAYVARVQSVLQAGRLDNDLLFYWPEADEQDDVSGDSAGPLMRQHGMHENEWLVQSVAGQRARGLLESGHSLDFISDAQIRSLSVRNGLIAAPGGQYRAIVVPATKRMPVETLAALLKLRVAGARLQVDAWPEDVPGYGRLAERRAQLRELLRSAPAPSAVTNGLLGGSVSPEPAAKLGLWFTRRARADGRDYFFVNATGDAFEGWVPLATRGERALLMDPLTGDAGGAATASAAGGRLQVYLQLPSGGSMIVRTFDDKARSGPAWRYLATRGEARVLAGRWRVEFTTGGPALPASTNIDELTSWTAWSEAGARFSGTARYRLEFQAPEGTADDWLLDLGDVRETARVTLNGKPLRTLWSLPANLRIGSALEPGANVLEIEVTNLPANRVRDLDLRKVDWKIMKDINLASLRYQALDATTWQPQPSGLLGPVRLVPLTAFVPQIPPPSPP